MDTFGQRVETLRKAAKIKSVRKLAELVGVAQPTMRSIANDETNPNEIQAATFMGLVKVLRTNAFYLWTGRGPAGPQIAPDTEDAAAALLYRDLTPRMRAGWMAAGYAMRENQAGTDEPAQATETPKWTEGGPERRVGRRDRRKPSGKSNSGD